jgi:ADP-ribose pyrophosphatase YjhB (NUDIX family)
MGGFFQMLYAYKTRREAETAEQVADTALAAETRLSLSLDQLTTLVHRQQRELDTLRALVAVLAGVLRDTGVVEADLLDFRIEAALDQVAALEDAEDEKAELLACLRCGASVPREQTVVTGDGILCDRCSE